MVLALYKANKRRHLGLQISKKNHPVALQITELSLIKVGQLQEMYCQCHFRRHFVSSAAFLALYRVVKRELLGLLNSKKNHPVALQITELSLIKVGQLQEMYCQCHF